MREGGGQIWPPLFYELEQKNYLSDHLKKFLCVKIFILQILNLSKKFWTPPWPLFCSTATHSVRWCHWKVKKNIWLILKIDDLTLVPLHILLIKPIGTGGTRGPPQDKIGKYLQNVFHDSELQCLLIIHYDKNSWTQFDFNFFDFILLFLVDSRFGPSSPLRYY